LGLPRYRVLQLYAERFLGIEPSSDPDQALGEVAVYAPVARCVGVGQVLRATFPRMPR
jgi:hypothetical protein